MISGLSRRWLRKLYFALTISALPVMLTMFDRCCCCWLLTNMSINVFSCFRTEPRRRREESGQAIQRRAFRLCIADYDRDRLLDARKLPDSITISEWYYIPPEIAAERRAAATRRAGERRRDTSEPEENSAFHQVPPQEASAARFLITGVRLVLLQPIQLHQCRLSLTSLAWRWRKTLTVTPTMQL